MIFKKFFLLIIPSYVIMVGFIYAATIILDLPLFKAHPPGSYYLLGISVFFLISGIFFIIKALRGDLKRKGGTVIDVRIDAVGKMDSIELLTQIAKNDPVKKVREKAKNRLNELVS